MPLHPSWFDIGLRLALTLAAGALLGLDRGAHGHAAGLRTVMLVGLAAAIAMIQANLLLPVGGKKPDSFGVMDLMRMPLGILTGVGFIGGGAILRRGDMVRGVTTAATLWLVTVVGLCFGGGQLVLGVAGTVLGLATLFPLRTLDRRLPREHRARLVIRADAESPFSAVAETLAPLKADATFRGQRPGPRGDAVERDFQLWWRRPDMAGPPTDILEAVNRRFEVVEFEITSETPA